MNPNSLKYSEVFSFLSFIFLIVLVLVQVELRRTQEVAALVPSLETELSNTRATAAKVPDLRRRLANAESQANEELANLQAQLDAQAEAANALRAELDQLRTAENASDRPPIVILSERNQNYRFGVGSAEITPDFQRELDLKVVPMLAQQARECRCDALEVVGHTDGLPINGSSNLDRNLVRAFTGADTELSPGSNIDLGMMRALSIIRYLKEAQQQGQLSGIRYFIPYSAGQMLRTDYSLETSKGRIEDRSRRRITLRLLDSSAWGGAAATRTGSEAPPSGSSPSILDLLRQQR